MANERTVDALTRVLLSIVPARPDGPYAYSQMPPEALAKALAARGVRVPSEPTRENATHLAQIATEILRTYDAGPKTPGQWIGEWRLTKGQSIVVAHEERQVESGRFRLYVAPLNGKVREAGRPLNWSKLRDQRGAYLADLLADTRQELDVEE